MVDDLSQYSLWDLFRIEAQNQNDLLSSGLLDLESENDPSRALQSLMRIAHSLKGAARVVELSTVSSLAHAMEDIFQKLQALSVKPNDKQMDALLAASDFLSELNNASDETFEALASGDNSQPVSLESQLRDVLQGIDANQQKAQAPEASDSVEARPLPEPAVEATGERQIRVNADQMQAVTALSGEIVINSEWLTELSDSMVALRKTQYRLMALAQRTRESLPEEARTSYLDNLLSEMMRVSSIGHQQTASSLNEIDSFAIKLQNLASRLNHEAMQTRMRPFSEGTKGLPRLVRDLAKSLDKQINLVIEGKDTPVDRDILDRLDAPLNHLIRNACDHGLETAEERLSSGKDPVGTLTVRATHKAGTLSIAIEDDGRGIHLESIRERAIDKGLIDAALAESMPESATRDLLFAPGFSTREDVTDISGRGVGLDSVQTDAREMGGMVKVMPRADGGTQFLLQLPITHSVVRSLLVEIHGEPYAIPLTRINRIHSVEEASLMAIEDQLHLEYHGNYIPVYFAAEIFGQQRPATEHHALTLITFGHAQKQKALGVDRLLGETELVVRPLDERFGDIPGVGSTSITRDGDPILMLDIDQLQSLMAVFQTQPLKQQTAENRLKPILLAEDSLAVRELTRRQLEAAGYQVDAVVDGREAWQKMLTNEYSLLVTDLDMPHLTGLQLTQQVRENKSLRALPVIMYTTMDTEGARHQAAIAGVDAFIVKDNLQDGIIESIVFEYIGSAE
ncbi:MAG: hybrid sensor histidine kinase/response regulator [bacterium]